ncbi:DUF599 domain-containing protein [Dongia sedimenti]|uniref:DUF599 domain-containing protein n=1 Tax=Dongia sedimenti TaxID=3064282 RepID=A0ABU0YP05_9PROT|nr:DUF599 domain-containing protein [Rhodospirillaceae bacterium R-7]
MLSDFQIADWVALGFLIVVWHVYGWFADTLPPAGTPVSGSPRNLNMAMHRVRKQWMKRMVGREERVIDVILTGHTVNSIAFFASTSMIVIAGLVGTLGGSGSAFRVLESLSFAQVTTEFVFQLKIVGLIGMFVIAFYKFTWALRQYNFLCALIGAAPAHDAHPTEAEVDRFADHASRMLSLALTSFNGGIRAFYFAVAWLAWFIHPLAFIATTAVMVAVLYKRQTSSRSQAAVMTYLDMLERK